MLYGISPFVRNVFDPFDIWGAPEKNYMSKPMHMNSCTTDIRDEGDTYVMESEMPGFEKEDIKLDLSGTQLTIAAEHSTNNDEKDDSGNYIRCERYYGKSSRSFYVGEALTEEDIKAKYEDGILKINVPKKEVKPVVDEAKYISIEG